MVDAQISIPSFTIEGTITYYHISIVCQSKAWSIRKRYSDFTNLYGKLNYIISNFPQLPPKKYLYLDKQLHHETRRKSLEAFLYQCSIRTDISTSSDFLKFLNINAYTVIDSAQKEPKLITCMSTYFTMAVTQCRILIGKLLTIENVMDAVDIAIESFKGKTLSKVKLWELGNYSLTSIWELTYPFRVCIAEIFDDVLFIGTADGELLVYKNEGTPCLINRFQRHKKAIRAIYFVESVLTSIGEDGNICINHGKETKETKICDYGLLCMTTDLFHKAIIAGDTMGSIYKISINSTVSLMESCSVQYKAPIKGLEIDSKHTLYVGTELGLLQSYKYAESKFELVASLDLQEQIRCIYLIPQTLMLSIGTRKGVIRFYSCDSHQIVSNINAHSASVKYICGNQKSLFTTGKDKSISKWVLPDTWCV